MGIGFVLIVYLVFGSLAALVGAAVCRWAAGVAVPDGAQRRGKIIRLATALPFLSLAWAGCVFVFQGAVNTVFLHRDVGLGDAFECPLPHGYKLTCIDDTDIGRIEAINGGARFDWVRRMQFSAHFLLVSENTHWLQTFPREEGRDDEWHILDMRTQRDEVFGNRVDFEKAARDRDVTIRLEPVGSFYARYRFTWFDAFAGLLLIAVPVFLVLILLREIRRTRQKIGGLRPPVV